MPTSNEKNSPGIKFPILNITLENWSEDLVFDIFLGDDTCYTPDRATLQRYYIENRFVDSQGHIYRLREVVPLETNFWQRTFSGKKGRFVFEETGERMPLKDLKEWMKARVDALDWPDVKTGWIEEINAAASIEELLKSKDR